MGTPEGRRHLGTAVFFALATTALPGQVTAGEDLKASVCAGECGALARDALGDECGPGSMDTSGLDKYFCPPPSPDDPGAGPPCGTLGLWDTASLQKDVVGQMNANAMWAYPWQVLTAMGATQESEGHKMEDPFLQLPTTYSEGTFAFGQPLTTFELETDFSSLAGRSIVYIDDVRLMARDEGGEVSFVIKSGEANDCISFRTSIDLDKSDGDRSFSTAFVGQMDSHKGCLHTDGQEWRVDVSDSKRYTPGYPSTLEQTQAAVRALLARSDYATGRPTVE